MLHLIHCRYKRDDTCGWEKGFIITTDIDGQDKPGYIIREDGSILSGAIWDIRIEHHYGHFHLNFE